MFLAVFASNRSIQGLGSLFSAPYGGTPTVIQLLFALAPGCIDETFYRRNLDPGSLVAIQKSERLGAHTGFLGFGFAAPAIR